MGECKMKHFRSNMPYCENKVKKEHTFDRRSNGSTVFPFTTSEVGHPTGVPLRI